MWAETVAATDRPQILFLCLHDLFSFSASTTCWRRSRRTRWRSTGRSPAPWWTARPTAW